MDSNKTIFQLGILQALAQGYFDGEATVAELKQKGNIGIGTFDAIDGELIVLDGDFYKATSDTSIEKCHADTLISFATVSQFSSDIYIEFSKGDFCHLKNQLEKLSTDYGRNQFYIGKIDCNCNYVTVRSELKQTKPYGPLNIVMKTAQRSVTHNNSEGTIVAVYYPDYMDGINTPGWHLHYISKDKSFGGHVLDIDVLNGKGEFEKSSKFQMYIPDNKDYNNMNLARNLQKEIKEVEG